MGQVNVITWVHQQNPKQFSQPKDVSDQARPLSHLKANFAILNKERPEGKFTVSR
ncbi:conserved hypothetical protein [Ricinus communis]|uniref:Uncharacterized protein n=1 Tax=Ricinus communis TaxID=3988 RepID=B9RAC6_RICCO|nr:conserved hypothetical protein [Ricinus communis]